MAGTKRAGRRALGMATATVMVVGAVVVLVPTRSIPPRAVSAPTSANAKVAKVAKEALAAQPLRFEANQGQFDPQVRFLARGRGYTLFLTPTEAVMASSAGPAVKAGEPTPSADKAADQPELAGRPDAVRIGFSGANPAPKLEAVGRLGGVSNYIIGNNPAAWHTNVAAYAKVRYRNMYPGIDLVFYEAPSGALEYDFEVAPGADPAAIALAFSGAAPTLEPGGDLVLRAGAGEFRQHKPVVYQGRGSGRREVPGAFTVGQAGRVGFSLGPYDRHQPLVIDPAVTYATYLGGSTGGDDRATGVAADAAGYAYVTGITASPNFPTAGSPPYAGSRSLRGDSDHFVTKLDTNASGASSLVWSTFLGGSGSEGRFPGRAVPEGIAVDTVGNVFISGTTGSADFPVTANAADAGCGTDTEATCNGTDNTYTDGQAIIGSTTYRSATATFATSDVGRAISGANIPAGATIAALVDAGSTITLSAPATGSGVALSFTIAARDPSRDAFLTKLAPAGSALLYSTYLGGGALDLTNGVALGPGGVVTVVGATQSASFPTTAGSYDTGCGTDAACNAADYIASDGQSTLGSDVYVSNGAAFTSTDVGKAITGTNIAAGTTVAGVTNRSTIRLSVAANGTGTGLSFTIAARSPKTDAFLATFDTTASGAASRRYATFLGGAGSDRATGVAVDSAGRAYVAGVTNSANFPTNGAYQALPPGGFQDGFVARLDPAVPGAGALLYSTYLGGNGNDEVAGVAADATGNAYVTGYTNSANPAKFPTTGDAYQPTKSGTNVNVFVTKLNTATTGAASLVYSTYLAGTGDNGDRGQAIAVGPGGKVTVVGYAFSNDFPQVRPVQPAKTFATREAPFVAQLDPGLAGAAGLVYSTFLGEKGLATAVALAGGAANNPDAYVVGSTNGDNFTTTASAYQSSYQGSDTYHNGFVVRLNQADDAAVLAGSSPRGGPTSGGTTVVLTGSGFGPATGVRFGAVAAVSFNVDSPTKITAVSPACDGCTTANITVQVGATSSNSSPFVYGEGLFSPTGTCTGCGPMMVRLNNGKVLSAGGPAKPSQLYDPATGTWSEVGPCPAGCGFGGESLTVLADGKVLLAGGANGALQAESNAFVYSPGSNSWAATASMTQPRSGHTATLLANGKVLVTGGCVANCDGSEVSQTTAELFDPAGAGGAGQWSPTGAMSTARWLHSATRLEGPRCAGASPPSYCNKVLVAGGMSAFQTIASTELYDPATGLWASAGTGAGATMTNGRFFHGATLLDGPACTTGPVPPWCGKVLVVGGGAQLGEGMASAELYDPAAAANSRWAVTGSMASARAVPATAQLSSGKVLVVAGSTAAGEVYNPAAGTWASAGGTKLPPMGGRAAVTLAPGPATVCGTNCGKVVVNERDHVSGAVNTDLYTPRPAVTSISPTDGPPGTTVTITGTGLASVDKVSFGTARTAAVSHDPANPDTVLTVVNPGTLNTAGGVVDVTAASAGGVSLPSTAARFTHPAFGYIRATTNPAVPAQITVDGQVADTWGTNWVATPVGPHTVCFKRDIEGFTTPACQNISVTQGATTAVQGNYAARGYLQVGTGPCCLSDAVISVKAPGETVATPRDNHTLYTDFAPGTYQVCWGPVADLSPPACQDVAVTAGQLTTVIGNYTSSPGAPGPPATEGLLRVTTSPAVPAQISVDGVVRDTWSLEWLRMAPGAHTVCFARDIEGFTTPECQSVNVASGATTTVTGTYIPRGFLQVGTSPCCQSAAVISVNGVVRDNATLYTDFAPGPYTVCWGTLADRTAPACRAVQVVAGQTTLEIGTYG